MPKRLLILIPNLRGSGCERVVVAMLPALARQYKIRLITYDDQCKYQMCEGVEWKVIDSPNIAVPGLWRKGRRMLSRVFSISASMRDFGPDLVLTFIDTCNIVGWAAHSLARLDCPIIAAEHTIGQEFFRRNSHANKYQFVLKNLLNFVYGRVSRLIAVSQSMSQYMRADLRINRKVDVVYNGFDATIYCLPTSFSSSNSNLTPWPRILAVGALSENKNQQLLISAFPYFKEHFPRAVLTLVGEGELHEELKSQAQKCVHERDIVFVGWSDSVADFYKKSDLLVHASQYESFGNVVVEGFMCGLPAVCTPATSAYSEVFFAPYCGEVISSWRVDEMVGAVVRVLTKYSSVPSFRIQLAIESAKKFSIEHMISGYEFVLHEAMANSKQKKTTKYST